MGSGLSCCNEMHPLLLEWFHPSLCRCIRKVGGASDSMYKSHIVHTVSSLLRLILKFHTKYQIWGVPYQHWKWDNIVRRGIHYWWSVSYPLLDIEVGVPTLGSLGLLPHLMAPTCPQNNAHNNQMVMKVNYRVWRLGGDHLFDQRSSTLYHFEVNKLAIGEVEAPNSEGPYRKARMWCCRDGGLHWLPYPLLSK